MAEAFALAKSAVTMCAACYKHGHMIEGDQDDLAVDAESTNTHYVTTMLCRESDVIMDQTRVYFPKGDVSRERRPSIRTTGIA